MLKLSGFLLGLVVLVCMVGCGGGSSSQALPTPTPTPLGSALVTPTVAAVPIGGSLQFVGTSFPGTITWSINPSVGTINPANGFYQAPATFPSPNTITVTATSGSTTASSTITVVFPNNNAGAQAAPIKLGSSGGNVNDVGATVCCIGTLGSLWTRADLPNPVILSNNHVLARSSLAANGEAIAQPGAAACFNAPITVANLTAQAALKPTSGTTGPAPSNVDAAIAQIVTGQVDTAGTILDLGATAGATSIPAAPPSATVGVPTLNMAVAKVGRTSGLTCSTITSLNTSTQVAYETACGSNVTAFTAQYTNQLVINGGNFSAGGDSGSLIVDSTTARPVGLLYGGSTTDTVANPIGDVIVAFTSGANVPAPVGGADHAVSCAPESSGGTSGPGALSTTVPISPEEHQRVAAIQGHAATVMKDAAIQGFAIGASADNPGEGALIIKASRGLSIPVPPVIDGVRTRVVFDSASGVQPSIGQTEIDHATAVKEAHVGDLLGKGGIQGVGVSISADNPAETAISIYVIKGMEHPPIPAVIDGVRTRIFTGSQFKAY